MPGILIEKIQKSIRQNYCQYQGRIIKINKNPLKSGYQ
ncbi:hypothetical protein SPONL_25 [uncultured Candidatus Thioglobus sp.]|nr:hypothetical protein SPONL_25 [uncultured Candidatus Thioglobus sp.]